MAGEPMRLSRGNLTAKEAAEKVGRSARSARRWTSIPRADYLRQTAERREAIRHWHDDLGHSWPQTGERFGISSDAAKKLGYRARKERAAEAAAAKARAEREAHERENPPLFQLPHTG